MEEKIKQLEEFISKTENKDFDMYFFVIDTKGNASGGVANIYEHVKLLNDLGYRAHILHETEDYMKVGSWLGEDYDKLSHICIKSSELKIKPVDYLFIPEIFYSLMEQCKNFPCKKIVFAQNYNYALEGLPIGKTWDKTYNFRDVITTSKSQADFYTTLFKGVKPHVIPVSISDTFTPTDDLKEPVILINGRDQSEVLKIVKYFYLKYPQYQWVSFKEVRNIPKYELHKELSKGCLLVWLDPTASFGTLPLESMACGTPVLGVIPKMIPEWMLDSEGKLTDNGIWTDNEMNVPDLIAQYFDYWLEDSVPDFLSYESISEVSKNYSPEKQKEILHNVYSNMVEGRIEEFKKIVKEYEK